MIHQAQELRYQSYSTPDNKISSLFAMFQGTMIDDILLYTCNIFALNSVYIVEILKRLTFPTLAVQFERLKNRLFQK
jgi:hypothetical protein